MAAEFPLREDFELGGWTVRPGRLILERDGEVVHVKPKTMEVLVSLADAAGEVVTREQLLEKVWQNAYVTDDVITQAIGELRRALRDDFRQPAFVETVPRRGYRLLQPVRALRSASSPEPTFEVAGGDAVPDTGRKLSRRAAVASIAAVALVAVGGFAFYVGSGVLGGIASELRLLRESTQSSRETRPTRDTEAYELYLKARQKFRYRDAAEQNEEALGLVQRAVERDPGFAEAYALIADIHTVRGFWNRGPHEEMLVKARQAAEAALEIDPKLSYPHAVLGLATAVLEWKWEEGYLQAVRATDLDPGDGRSLSLRAVLSLTRGRSTEAVKFAYEAYELEPINPNALGTLSWVLYQARDYDKAAEFMAKTLEEDPGAPFARNFRPLALAFAGRFEDALAAENERVVETGGKSAPEFTAFILLRAGRHDEARRIMSGLTQTPPGEAISTAWVPLVEKDVVFERLDRMIEKRMTSYLMWLQTGPAWDPVRDDPRFQKVLERVGLTGQGSDQNQTAQPGRREPSLRE